MAKPVPLRVLRNDILFQFVDEDAVLNDGKNSQRGFKERTSWGFEFVSSKDSAGQPRWGIVRAIGPEVKENIYVGRHILIENLKWTEGLEFGKETFWKTNEEQVIGVNSDEDR